MGRGLGAGASGAGDAARAPAPLPGGPVLPRAPRGAVLGVLAVGLSALGHAGAGGAHPTAAVLGLAAAGALLGALVEPWARTLPRLVLLLGAAQVAVHVALSAAATAAASSPLAIGPAPSRAMGGMGMADATPAMDGMAADGPGMAGHAPTAGSAMLVAHAVAVVLAACAVRCADRGVEAAAALIASVRRWIPGLSRPLAPAVVLRSLAPAPPWPEASRGVGAAVRGVRRRGPPLRAFA